MQKKKQSIKMKTEHSDDCTQSNPTGYQTPLEKAFIEGMVPDEEDRLGNVAARVLLELTPLLERLCVVSPWRSSRRGISVEEEVTRMQHVDMRFNKIAIISSRSPYKLSMIWCLS